MFRFGKRANILLSNPPRQLPVDWTDKLSSTEDTIIHGYALHSFYGCGIHLLAAIWSSVTHLLLHPARRIKTNQANQPEEQQPAKTFLTTEESGPITPSTSENQHPAHNVHHTFSILDEVKNYDELRKLLDRN